MKKIISLLIVSVMLCTLGLSVFADDVVSPVPPRYRGYIVVHDGGGEVFYEYDPETEIWTIKADPDNDHDFEKWKIEGDVEFVDGTDEYDKEAKIKANSDFEAVAYFKTKGADVKVTVEEGTKGGSATAVKNADGTWTLKAETDKGYKFTKWTVTGTYTVVSGSLTSETLVINPITDFHAVANWNGQKKDGGKSPQTGYSAAIIAVVAVASVAGAAYAFKKFENA